MAFPSASLPVYIVLPSTSLSSKPTASGMISFLFFSSISFSFFFIITLVTSYTLAREPAAITQMTVRTNPNFSVSPISLHLPEPGRCHELINKRRCQVHKEYGKRYAFGISAKEPYQYSKEPAPCAENQHPLVCHRGSHIIGGHEEGPKYQSTGHNMEYRVSIFSWVNKPHDGRKYQCSANKRNRYVPCYDLLIQEVQAADKKGYNRYLSKRPGMSAQQELKRRRLRE